MAKYPYTQSTKNIHTKTYIKYYYFQDNSSQHRLHLAGIRKEKQQVFLSILYIYTNSAYIIYVFYKELHDEVLFFCELFRFPFVLLFLLFGLLRGRLIIIINLHCGICIAGSVQCFVSLHLLFILFPLLLFLLLLFFSQLCLNSSCLL